MLASSGAPFSYSPPLPAHAHAHAYTPTRPSPLSPRSANACYPRHFSSSCGMPPKPSFSPSSAARNDAPTASSPRDRARPQPPPTFQSRDLRTNPVARRLKQTPDEARERRRGMFMRKVEQGRAEKAWEGRSDFILRSDFLNEQRRWEAERRREAPWMAGKVEEEEEWQDMAGMNAGPETLTRRDEDEGLTWEIEEVAQREEDELRELIGLQEKRGRDEHVCPKQFDGTPAAARRHDQDRGSAESSPTRYGSDEEEYEEIFRDLISSPAIRGSFEAREDAEMMDWA